MRDGRRSDEPGGMRGDRRSAGHGKSTVILLLLTAAAFALSLCWGRYHVPLSQVLKILAAQVLPLTQTWDAAMEAAVIQVRLPRILMAWMIGASLSVAGAAYQGVFQNPLASPDLLGASSGAGFGAALGIILGLSRGMVTALAFSMSLLTVGVVSLLSKVCRGNRIMNIILAGMMVSALFTAGTSWIKLMADPSEQLPAITYWLMGSLSGTRFGDVLFAAPVMAVGILAMYLIRWRINLLTVREEEAKTMGVRIERIRWFVILASTLLTATSVAAAGMIGWIGLIVPHLCRRLVGNDYRFLIPATVLCGGCFLLLTDNLARNLTVTEFPIGILTAFVGAPFFLYLMARKGGNL